MRLPFSLAELSAGSSSAAKMAIITMTTNSSIKVKAPGRASSGETRPPRPPDCRNLCALNQFRMTELLGLQHEEAPGHIRCHGIGNSEVPASIKRATGHLCPIRQGSHDISRTEEQVNASRRSDIGHIRCHGIGNSEVPASIKRATGHLCPIRQGSHDISRTEEQVNASRRS